MAIVGAGVLNMVDIAKRLDPDGRQAKVAELLAQTNEVIDDATWVEGNLPTGNRTTVRTGLPLATVRLLNSGAGVGKSSTAQIDEQCAKIETFSQMDLAVANLGGDPGAARLSEAQSFFESMNQTFASMLFYGSAVTPAQFVGFAPRYSSLEAGNAQNIVDGGGTGSDNTSIYLVVWGQETVSCIYPKGSIVGLQHNDLGIETATMVAGNDTNTSLLRVYRDQFVWDCGLMVKNWKYAVRIANIDVSNLVGESSAADITKLMTRAIKRIPSLKMGKAAFYMNGTVEEMLDIQRREAVQIGGQLRYDQVDGIWQASFRNIPVRRVDQLLLTEARVT